MSVSIVPTAPQIVTSPERPSRVSRGGDPFATDAGAGTATAESSSLRNRDRDYVRRSDGAPIPRLSPQTLGALTAPSAETAQASQQQPPAETGSTTGTTNGTSAPGNSVAIDFIHVELPNGVKFELRHIPRDGESSDEAMQSLLKAAEELAKVLGGNVGPTATDKDKDAATERGGASATAYARQSSAYTTRMAREGTTLTV